MMNKLAVVIVVILFPGIVAAIISNRITVHNAKWDYFKYGMYSFVLGISCYIALQLVCYVYDIILSYVYNISPIPWTHLQSWEILQDTDTKIKSYEIFMSSLLALPISCAASYLINHKIFNKLANKLHISDKYGDENLFSYYLNAKEIDWVYVRDKENSLTYQGRVNSYSETDSIQEIVLYDVTVYTYDDSEELYSLPSMYLCKTMGKFTIEQIPSEIMEETNVETTS